MANRYDWGDGKGKVHTRPKRTGPQLERAKDRKRLADPTYFSQPMTLGDVLREAGRADELRYGGVQGQLGLQQQQIPAWFQDYKNTILTPQQVQQQYQPAIQKQEAVAQETAKPLGLEGQAGEQDQLAAKAREALANLGTSVLTNAQQADTTYFQNRQGVAQAAQLGAQTQNAQQIQDLARERGAFRDQYVTDARDRERKYGLDLQHQAAENKAFDLDVAEAAGINPLTGKPLPPKDKKDVITSGPFAGYTKGEVRRMDPAKKARLRKRASAGKPHEPVYGVNYDEWLKMTPAQRAAAKKAFEGGGKGGNGKDAFGNTKVQRRTNNNQWSAAKAWLKNVPDDLLNNPALATKVGKETGAAFDIAKIALFRRKNRYITAAMARKLDRLGVKYSPNIVGKRPSNGPGTSSGGGGGPEGTGQTTYHG